VQSGLAQAQHRIRESLGAHPELTIILDASGSPSSRLRGRFLEKTGSGMKVQLTTALGAGMVISIAGQIETEAGSEPVLGKFRIGSCRLAGIGKYHAEMFPHLAAEESSEQESSQQDQQEDELDCYEVLQVSRRADTDTIRRVFHVLAQRYHPDNTETGNDKLFRQVVEANAVLSDPERRAAHDVQLANDDKVRFKIFDNLQSTQGVQAEIRKRQGVLRLLYTKRLTDPHQPAMRARDFVEMLGCPLEHLEFSLWFLRENKLIIRSDNNHFEITWQGVAAFEAEETTFGRKTLVQLPAPA
jgi:DnaJ-like protein